MSKPDAGLEARRQLDIKMLERAIPLVDGKDVSVTFNDWLRRIQTRDKMMRELGVQRRSFVKNTLAKLNETKAPPVTMTKYTISKADMRDYSQEVMCGARPLTPPGVTGNQPRFGVK